VQFEVNNKPSVTSVMNYPNPFTTNTKFVFTLTGSEVPEVFTIQIMTISGKIVKEITREELGNVHIGRNNTDYSWDGRDMYGDRLGNGVYLYKIVTKLNGENMEKAASGADKYIKHEFGKMVLMR
jgi:flagellar hook assembly protein FlgD